MMISDLFKQGEWYEFDYLRNIAAVILRKRQSDPILSEKLRTNEIPGSKSWNEELFPLKLLADHKKLANDDKFRWTPNEAADFEVRAACALIKIQSTMAYAEWSEKAGVHGGHVRHLEMEKLNADRYNFGGGLVVEPRARGFEEDLRAWREGIKNALTRKLKSNYAGCRLLIFAPLCRFNSIDFAFREVVSPAVEEVGAALWGQTFEGLYILDNYELAFVEFYRGYIPNLFPASRPRRANRLFSFSALNAPLCAASPHRNGGLIRLLA